MFRQTHDSDALYADAAIRGSGQTALQYRRTKGGIMQTILFNIGAPQRVRRTRRLVYFSDFPGCPSPKCGSPFALHAAPQSPRRYNHAEKSAIYLSSSRQFPFALLL